MNTDEIYYTEKLIDEIEIQNLLKMYELKLIGKNALKEELTKIKTNLKILL